MRNLRMRSEQLAARGHVPASLIPVVVADAALCSRCLIRTLELLRAPDSDSDSEGHYQCKISADTT